MARPKKGTPEGDRANEKYKQTMLERFGSQEAINEHFRKMGAKGGINGHTGGFAANKELAKVAGAKGGKNSTRGAAVWPEIEKHKDEVRNLYLMGIGIPEISRRLGFTNASIRLYIKKNF